MRTQVFGVYLHWCVWLWLFCFMRVRRLHHFQSVVGNKQRLKGPNKAQGVAYFFTLFSITQSGDTLYISDIDKHSLRTINKNTTQVCTLVSNRITGGHGSTL